MSEPPVREHGPARDRAVARSALSGAILQGSIVLTALVSLPAVARDLTPAEFGVLTILTGLLGLLSFADLGIGSALTTRVAQCEVSGDRIAAQHATSTALFASGGVAILIVFLMGGSAWLLPWPTLLGAERLPPAEIRAAVLVTGVAVALGVVGSLGQRVLYGLHRGGRANAWLAIGALGSGVLTIVVAVKGGGLVALVTTSLVVPSVVGLACTTWTLGRQAAYLRPRWGAVSGQEWHRLRGQSGWFFVIALSGAIAFQTDALIVAGVLGAASAGVYGVVARLFGIVSQTMYPGLLQLWPAFTDAHLRGEHAWIRSRLGRAIGTTSGVALVSGIFLVIAGPALVGWWLVDDLVPPRDLLIAFALWTAYSLGSAAVYLLFNAVGLVRLHGQVAVAVAVINLPVSWGLTHAVGIAGPVWGSLFASVACSLIPAMVVCPRVLRGEVSALGVRPVGRTGRGAASG